MTSAGIMRSLAHRQSVHRSTSEGGGLGGKNDGLLRSSESDSAAKPGMEGLIVPNNGIDRCHEGLLAGAF